MPNGQPSNGGTNGSRKPKILLIHYSGPPTISGVDVMIRDQARLFRLFNYKVNILAGSGKQFRKDIPVKIFRRISANHPVVFAVRKELEQGTVSHAFHLLERSLYTSIRKYILQENIRIVIIHNIMTRHYNLALTSALVRLMNDMPDVRFVAWVHDTTFYDDPYFKLSKSLASQYPWNNLVTSHDRMTYVCVSDFLKDNLERALASNPPKDIVMIPNGHDIPKFLGLSPVMRQFYNHINGLDADLIGLIPVRAVPRKKLEFGIAIAQKMVERGVNFKLILTANIDRKREENVAYYDKLRNMVVELGLSNTVYFLEDYFREHFPEKPDARIPMPEAYLMSDFLLLTSSLEGFGLPLLEAGLIRCPIFASDIPPFREIGTTNINYFNLNDNPERVADFIFETMKSLPQAYFYRKVIRNYSLKGLFQRQVIPLIDRLAPKCPDAAQTPA